MYKRQVQSIATIEIEAKDWNCPQYLPRLVEIERLEELVVENEKLKLALEQIQEK